MAKHLRILHPHHRFERRTFRYMLTPISESELFIMQYLWSEKEQGRSCKSFAEILDHSKQIEGKEWKKQTINTFLTRLHQKGLVSVTVTDKNFLYAAKITRARYLQLFLENILPPENVQKTYTRFFIHAIQSSFSPRQKDVLVQQALRLFGDQEN